jgi:hypothetical protein
MLSAEQNRRFLEQAFEFMPEELELNRVRQLSPAQEAKLVQYRRARGCGQRMALIVFGATSVGLLALPYVLNEPSMDQARPFLLGTAVIFFAIFILSMIGSYLSGRDLAQGRIDVIEGQVKTWSKNIKSQYGNLGTAYYLKIGRKKFQLETAQRMQALNNGRRYRFYVVPNGRVPIILSVESLDE